MLLTTHAITGATVCVLTGNPLLGFGAAVLSHHVLDALPHFDQGSFYIQKDKGPEWAGAKYGEKKKFAVRRDWIILFTDAGAAAVIFTYLFLNTPFRLWPLIILGGIGGILPDVLDVSPFWRDRFQATRIGKVWHHLHYLFHWPLSMKYLPLGLGLQIIICAVFLFLIRRLFFM